MAMQSGFIKRIRDIMRMDAGINGDAQRIEQMVWMLFLKVYDAKEDDWELNEDNYESIIPEDLRWRNWAKADGSGHAMTGDKLLNFVNNTLFPVLKGNDVKDGDAVLYEGIKVTPDTPIKKAIVKSTFEDANNYMKDGVYLRQVIDVTDEIEFDDVKESHAFGFVYEEILRELQSAGSSGEFYTPRAVTEFMALMIKPQLGEKMADFACGTGGFITSWLGQLSKQVTDTAAQKQLDDSIYGIEKKPFPYLLCVTNMLLHDIEVPNIYHMNSLKHNLLDYTDDDKFDVILMNPPYGGHEDKSIQGFFPDDLASSETADLFMSVILYRLKKNGRAAVVVPDGFLFGLDNAKVNIKKKLIGEFNLHTVVRLPGSVFSPYTSITTNLLFFDNTRLNPIGSVLMAMYGATIGKLGILEIPVTTNQACCACIPYAGMNNKYLFYYLMSMRQSYIGMAEGGAQPNISKEKIVNSLIPLPPAEEQRRIVAKIEELLPYVDRYAAAYEKLEQFNAKFPEDMKKSILQYAIQGKLVEQRAEEGTGEELYQQIQAEKQRLIAEKKIKKEKPLPEIAENEKPYDIPDNWTWVRFGDLGSYKKGPFGSAITKSMFVPKGNGAIKVYEQKNAIQKDATLGDYYIRRDYFESKMKGFEVFPGDIIVSCAGTIGETYVMPDKFEQGIINQALMRMKIFEPLYIPYFLTFFDFVLKKNARSGSKGSAIKNIPPFEILKNYLVPIPPLAEQRRIVAKLEEILPLCERLK